MRNHFDKIKLWNLQTCPTADDKVVQALTWTQLAQTVSSKSTFMCICINFTLKLTLLTATHSFAPGLVEYMTLYSSCIHALINPLSFHSCTSY